MDNPNGLAETAVATRTERRTSRPTPLGPSKRNASRGASFACSVNTAPRTPNAARPTPLDVLHAVAILKAKKSPNRPLTADEADALGVLYQRFATPLLRVATHLTNSEGDGEDVVHDVFVQLPRAIKKYRPGNLEGWLKRVTATISLMRLRNVRRRREDFPATLEFAPDDDIASRDIDALEDIQAVRNAVEQLPERLKRVVILKGFLGYSHGEIAALLRITRNTSEVRYCRATSMLRLLLRDTAA